eukprot:TRINITY_DN5215_c0_g1_i4.p2 TRINITY_DN5215_c0_g1~~TRINITY_DN5215_c0_g1_i4.p2  ORF type:complete len:108 (+),score=12.19 TRINITY_DN5215_c0_g1_i4:433-756(+)
MDVFGLQRPGAGRQAFLVQAAFDTLPLGGHLHLLQPSGAGKVVPAVQRSPVGHAILVQPAFFGLPVGGQVHVLHPSSAVNTVPGTQPTVTVGLTTGGLLPVAYMFKV